MTLFNDYASLYEKSAILPLEVGHRLLAQLPESMALPANILDLGGGTGCFAGTLKTLFPTSFILNLDASMGMIRQGENNLFTAVCGNAEILPFPNYSFDFIFSNCTLPWINHGVAALKECKRILKPGGVFLFSALGPDTLQELRTEIRAMDDFNTRNNSSSTEISYPDFRFLDLHDWGDHLLKLGFSNPVMQREIITMEYQDLALLEADIINSGFQLLLDRSKVALKDDIQCLFSRMSSDFEKSVSMTYEIVYGCVWRAVT